jgi:large subunit ribosomal protein L10
MPNPKKEQKVAEIVETLREHSIAILTDYRGLSHAEMTQVRAACREKGARFVVIKNRLLKLALKEAEQPDMGELLVGPTAIAFTRGDPAPTCKALVDYAKIHDALEMKGALIDGVVYGAEQIKTIASLPPAEVIYAQIAGGVVGGVQGIAAGLNELLAQLARVMNAVATKQAA